MVVGIACELYQSRSISLFNSLTNVETVLSDPVNPVPAALSTATVTAELVPAERWIDINAATALPPMFAAL